MADQTLLSELCSICNTTKWKYVCPGCAAHTCSLPCYKRHKQRAQCSGKRDPAKYVKKSQLSTPAGIDHDYNFITSIERGLDRAEKHISDRGLIVAPEKRAVQKKGEVTRAQYGAAGVNVIKAPKGLSRQRENTTHRSSRGRIIWTVEWIHEDKSRTLTETSEANPLISTYQSIIGAEVAKSKKKRKREAQEAGEACEAGKGGEPQGDNPPAEKILKTTPTPGLLETTAITPQKEVEKEGPQPATFPKSPPAVETLPDEPPPAAEKPSSEAPPADPPVTTPGLQTPSAPPDHYFYLLKPRVNSQKKVLIPISHSSTLSEILRQRTVLEFPTIYVLSTPPEKHPEEFMLEGEYLKKEEEEQKELEELLSKVDPEKLRAMKAAEESAKREEEVDSRAILDVLKKDVGALI